VDAMSEQVAPLLATGEEVEGAPVGLTEGFEAGMVLGLAVVVGITVGPVVGRELGDDVDKVDEGDLLGVVVGVIVVVTAVDTGSTTTRLEVKLAQYRFVPVSDTKVSCTCIPSACTTANPPYAALAHFTPAPAIEFPNHFATDPVLSEARPELT